MLEALGGRAAIDRVTSLVAQADCTGPEGPFTTSVWSSPPDRMRFEQRFGDREVAFVVAGDDGWRRDPATGHLQLVTPMQVNIVRGHDFHFMLLHADRWFSEPVLIEDGGRGGCRSVGLRDRLGRRAELCVDSRTSLPSSLTLRPPAGADPIVIDFEDWQDIAGVRYLKAFRLHHGKDVFTYRYRRIEPNGVDDAAFETGPRR